ncbi:MAG: glutathione-disulfide reductase, partial [Hyphomicrobium sp.]
MMAHDFDLFVIGGGSGGVRAARIAAGHGARVAIAEEDRFGGTCVIRGCVPKKLLVYASRFRDAFEDAAGFGWTVGPRTFDWATLIANKDREIARLEGIYRTGQVRAGVTVFDERAVVEGPNAIRLIKQGSSVTATKILIATGGRPNIDPNLPGREHVITSDEAFHLPDLPKRVVVAGGGYIAVEFACIFHGLGAETTLIYRGEKILRGFDEDMRDGL